tara:strand:- start:77 stop:667 length:591 start_codon:yes stop_codon:yes gene_type:complete
MSKNDRDYDIDVKNHYTVKAGQDSPYGKVSYRVLTNHGSSMSFHEDGLNKENLQTAVSGRSCEFLGEMIKRPRDAAQDPMVPAKWIKCKHGDVVIDCDDGDIILKADNIIMEAKGLTADNSGDIQMKANKGILVDAPDIRIVGSNLRLTARNEFTISAKVMGGIVAGVLQMASSADFGASIPLSKLTQLKEALEAE